MPLLLPQRQVDMAISGNVTHLYSGDLPVRPRLLQVGGGQPGPAAAAAAAAAPAQEDVVLLLAEGAGGAGAGGGERGVARAGPAALPPAAPRAGDRGGGAGGGRAVTGPDAAVLLRGRKGGSCDRHCVFIHAKRVLAPPPTPSGLRGWVGKWERARVQGMKVNMAKRYFFPKSLP